MFCSPLDLEILGCNASMDSMYAVTRTFENIRPRPNHNANHPVKNLSPSQVKQYLEDNSLRSCFLVMDAEIVKDAYENKKNDYEDLFNTLVDRVGKTIKCSFSISAFRLVPQSFSPMFPHLIVFFFEIKHLADIKEMHVA